MDLRKRFNNLVILVCFAIYLGIIILHAGEQYSSQLPRRQDTGEEKDNLGEDLGPSLHTTQRAHALSSSVTEEIKNTSRKRVRVWVLAGSLGRSGTSLIGQLMAEEKPSMFFFEPELYLQQTTGLPVSEEQGAILLREVYECRFQEGFIKWLYTRTKGNVVRHPMTSKCKSTLDCFTVDSLSRNCLQEDLRIMKVIRYRIRWIREILSDPSYDIKLIHMIRDPRAILRSLWAHIIKYKPSDVCPLIEDDLAQMQELHEKFPDKTATVKYEKFCLDPIGEATKLYRFLSNDLNATLPPPWLKFLEDHTHNKEWGGKMRTPVFGTVRDTREEYEAWRWEIDEELLVDTEKHCSSIISRLGHRLFGSLSVATNASVSLVAG